MPKDINSRLSQLSTRRRSLDRINKLSAHYATDLLTKSLASESWQGRATRQPHTQYTLGAMAAVDADDTRLHVESAEKVGAQLKAGLSMPLSFRIQGSVALDVHIRRVSDIDLLVLDDRFLTYDTSGVRANSGHYCGTHLTSLGALLEVRRDTESLLKIKYPAATVDCSGGKCIAMSGGSLARPVDVVPSHWNDTVEYQASQQIHDRGVVILNKKVPEIIRNLPFLHIKRVHDRDAIILGGLKKAIRLTKNVKADAENQATASGLPSFDIAALMYHADQSALLLGYSNELAILKEARRFLDWCWVNKAQAGVLRTPDDTRYIMDSSTKWDALLSISSEMDDLAKKVAAEQNAYLGLGTVTWSQIDGALASARVPF
jgi:hypothetical protein